ncbi:hypothetical protein [Nocardioides sp. SYSU D00065]|uniref:hypothetical protein n=1 Tax=Nocardioides sp. SYSU D00065 TaxID=2817378 RepID=UPI001B337390|nr:hypothetical protein [Nocardioides sp. SYSU D00065]
MADGMRPGMQRSVTVPEFAALVGPWQTYTPHMANLDVTGRTVNARYKRVGQTVKVQVNTLAGGQVYGLIRVSNPPGLPASPAHAGGLAPVGVAQALEDGNTFHLGNVYMESAAYVAVMGRGWNSAYVVGWGAAALGQLDGVMPFARPWRSGDGIGLQWEYETTAPPGV